MNPKYKKILVALTIISIGAFILSFFITKKLTIISTYPVKDSNLSNLNSPIVLEFNQKINLNDFKLEIIPIETFVSEQEVDTKITLKINKTLQINTKYSLKIVYKDKLIDTLSFTTNAPKDTQYDARFNQDVQNELDTQYPLIKKTPYNTTLYRVVYSAPMTLEITIKNENILPEKAFSEIRAWVTSVGGDADAHTYVISDKPLPSPAIVPTKAGSFAPTTIPSPTPFNWDTLQDDGT